MIDILMKLLIWLAGGAFFGALLGYFGKCSSGACPLTATPWRGAIYGAALAALFAYPQLARTSNAIVHEAVLHIDSTEQFRQTIQKADKPILADFFSHTCPPCRRLSPTINELAAAFDGKAIICKVNLDQAPHLAQAHGIRGIPAVIFFVNGKEVERLVGLRARSTYEKVLERVIENNTHKENQNAAL